MMQKMLQSIAAVHCRVKRLEATQLHNTTKVWLLRFSTSHAQLLCDSTTTSFAPTATPNSFQTWWFLENGIWEVQSNAGGNVYLPTSRLGAKICGLHSEVVFPHKKLSKPNIRKLRQARCLRSAAATFTSSALISE